MTKPKFKSRAQKTSMFTWPSRTDSDQFRLEIGVDTKSETALDGTESSLRSPADGLASPDRLPRGERRRRQNRGPGSTLPGQRSDAADCRACQLLHRLAHTAEGQQVRRQYGA